MVYWLLTVLYRFGNVAAMQLQSYLEEQKIRHDDFAEMLGVSEASVNRYANGKRIPAPPVMKKIAKVTKDNVTANDFYGLSASKGKSRNS